MPQDTIANLINKCKCQPKILKQSLLTYQNGISMLQNHFLFAATEEVVQRLIPMGIIQHSYEFHNWICLRPIVEPDENDPIVLTMDELEFGFIMWLAVCGLAVVGFIVEIIAFRLQNLVGIGLMARLVAKRPQIHLV